jgi:hypothetical protein
MSRASKICSICGKRMGLHRAMNLNCPNSPEDTPVLKRKWKTTRFVEKDIGDGTSQTTNKQISTAMWKRLNAKQHFIIPEKTEWVPVTRQRLNSAVKAVMKA